VVNIVGDHATSHAKYVQAPLTSDIMAITGSVSDWVHRCASAAEAAGDGARAVQAARAAPGVDGVAWAGWASRVGPSPFPFFG